MMNLKYNIPISILENTNPEVKDFMIQGVAISSTTTDNGHKFIPDELRLSAETLSNRPLLIDHDANLKSMAGRVIKAEFDESSENLMFKAKINNTEAGKLAKELISSGDLNTVSVGANVKSFEEDDEAIIPKGIKFKELSLVATPADDNAVFSLTNSLKEAYDKSKIQLINSQSIDFVEDNKTIKKEDKQMTEKAQKVIESEDEESKEEDKAEESNKELMEVKSEVSDLKKSFDSVKDLLAETLKELKEMKESDEDEEEPAEGEPEEESKEEHKEEESEDESEEEESEDEDDSVDEKGNYTITQNNRSFSIVKKNYR